MLARTATLLALACVPLACSSKENSGGCVGSFLGQPVRWALDAERSGLREGSSPREGGRTRRATLLYAQNPEDRFGLEVKLHPNFIIDQVNFEGPRIVPFTGSALLLHVQDMAVLGLQGLVGTAQGFGGGFQEPPGAPPEGTLRLDRVGDSLGESRFSGIFVYRYADGDELTCSFDVGT
jgi:hypothetical protein